MAPSRNKLSIAKRQVALGRLLWRGHAEESQGSLKPSLLACRYIDDLPVCPMQTNRDQVAIALFLRRQLYGRLYRCF